jgi:hypothetical protein
VKNGDIRVLLLGESTSNFHHLQKSLERRRCRCRRVQSYEEAHRALEEETPDIVLSAIPPQPGAISSMTERLAGSQASFYYAYPVENGCWWMPALHRGERCFGAPAMRPAKFTGVIDQVVEEIRAGRETDRKPAPVAALARLVPVRRARPRDSALLAFTKAAG